jgi:hypothetical protein
MKQNNCKSENVRTVPVVPFPLNYDRTESIPLALPPLNPSPLPISFIHS